MKIGHFIHDFLLGFNLKVLLLLLTLSLFLNCMSPGLYIQSNADFTFIKRIAVLPFGNLTNDKFAGEKIRDIVTTEVLSRGFFDVIEQGEVNKVLREEAKGDATAIGQDAVKTIGKRLGVQAFILGSVEEYEGSSGGGRSFPQVAISMRMIDVKSNKILWQVSYNKEGGGAISRLFGIGSKSISEISRELVKEMMDTLFKE